MAVRTIARMFDSYADATAAVRDLEAAGFLHDDISLVGTRAEIEGGDQTTSTAASGAGTGAVLGGVVGGGAGLLAGLGALAIPGLGPVVAAGWLIAAMTGAGVGAAAGGVLGALTGAGLSEDEANVYAEGLRRGGTLVTVRADEARVPEAERILALHGPVDALTRGEEYRAGGWSRYDTDATLGEPGLTYPDQELTRDVPDGAPGNPPGTKLSRGVDEVAGTNISGAHPENEYRRSAPDGTPGNPPGTKLSRGVDEVAGTNISGAHPENERPLPRSR